jgi:predicted nucleic acid-binding protein
LQPIALLAAERSKAFKLATADAIIYATARQHLATLVTSDAHFADFPQVKFYPK